MTTTIYMLFFLHVFLVFVSFLRKTSQILSFAVINQFFSLFHIISIAFSEEQMPLRSSSFWFYVGQNCFLFLAQNIYVGAFTWQEKDLGTRGECVAEEVLSSAFLIIVTSKIPGDRRTVTDWWEVISHNLEVALSAGGQRGLTRAREVIPGQLIMRQFSPHAFLCLYLQHPSLPPHCSASPNPEQPAACRFV